MPIESEGSSPDEMELTSEARREAPRESAPRTEAAKKSDREVMRDAVNEMLAATGGRLGTRPLAEHLRGLEERFGDRFSIEGACNALDDVIRSAERLKEELRKQQSG